ncbi:MAG: DUF4058 family protein [Fimbriiglobus sp.]
MPIHDWTLVSAGTWHDFHLAWTAELRNVLNDGLMPPGYYAQAEQIVGPLGPDVLALQTDDSNGHYVNGAESGSGGVAVAVAAPRPKLIAEGKMDAYALKRRTIVIRHNSGDRIVALIELVSPGNKDSRHAIRSFTEKAVEALFRGYHLLIVDLFPPTVRDPNGLHALIWGEFSDQVYDHPSELPLSLIAYSSGPQKKAYLEPTAVDCELIEMPLFLEPEMYVNIPLEATYLAAYRGVPRKWKDVLERR